MYPGDISNLSEQSFVILDNLYSAFEQKHRRLFYNSLKAVGHQLRSLELQQETKASKTQENDSFFIKECFAFLGGEESSPSKFQNFSKLQIQFAKQNHLWPESINQQDYVFNIKAISLSNKAKKLLRYKFDQLFYHSKDMMSYLESFLSIDYRKWLDFYLILHQVKTFQLSNISNGIGIICSDRFSCGEIHRVVRLETQDPQLVSEIFEKGFLKILIVTSFDQLRLLPNVIKKIVKEYASIVNNQRFGYIAILGITSANPEWQLPYFDLYPSVHLIRIFGANAWNSPYPTLQILKTNLYQQLSNFLTIPRDGLTLSILFA